MLCLLPKSVQINSEKDVILLVIYLKHLQVALSYIFVQKTSRMGKTKFFLLSASYYFLFNFIWNALIRSFQKKMLLLHSNLNSSFVGQLVCASTSVQGKYIIISFMPDMILIFNCIFLFDNIISKCIVDGWTFLFLANEFELWKHYGMSVSLGHACMLSCKTDIVGRFYLDKFH